MWFIYEILDHDMNGLIVVPKILLLKVPYFDIIELCIL